MKNNLKYRLSALLFLASALTITSCSDWTDVESLQLNTPTFEEQNPQLYADYLKDLNAEMDPIELTGTVEAPQDGHFSGTIEDWETVSGGDTDAN